MKHFLLLAASLWIFETTAAPAQESPASKTGLRFQSAGTNGFTFDTGVLRGKLRADGKSRGLSSVVHVPTGKRLDKSTGLFGHYRVFTTNQRYGAAAWDWPSEARLAADGSVEVRWPAAPDRPFELRAVYRWAEPNALDLVTSVQATTNLSHFESFLASYFADDFTNSLVCVNPADGKSAGFQAAEQSLGVWLAFTRDESFTSLVRDGRWQIQPNPVDWVILPRLAKPLGVRRSPASGLVALVMAPPSDCFAVSTPYQTEAHNSTYLSLFGSDLQPGKALRAQARLWIGAQLIDAEILRQYDRFVGSTGH